jgi:hypothetical protein
LPSLAHVSFSSEVRDVRTLNQGARGFKKNAPSFIYEILYGREKHLLGRTVAHREKMWKGIPVDEHIPTTALDELDDIEEIELRASCEGSGPETPTYLIFRFSQEPDENQAATFVRAMNVVEDIKCGAGTGSMGRYRFGVTAYRPMWYENNREEFVGWWLELPKKIRIVLTTIRAFNQGRLGMV